MYTESKAMTYDMYLLVRELDLERSIGQEPPLWQHAVFCFILVTLDKYCNYYSNNVHRKQSNDI